MNRFVKNKTNCQTPPSILAKKFILIGRLWVWPHSNRKSFDWVLWG